MKVGDKHHMLKALKYEGPNKHGKSMFLFLCDCGNKKIIKADEVSRSDRKATKSCGCFRRKKSRETMIKLRQHHWTYYE